MSKQAYRVLQQIHHDGLFYSPYSYPYTQPIIYAYPNEVAGLLSVGAIVLDPTAEVPPEAQALPPTPSTGTATKTPLLKPIA